MSVEILQKQLSSEDMQDYMLKNSKQCVKNPIAFTNIEFLTFKGFEERNFEGATMPIHANFEISSINKDPFSGQKSRSNMVLLYNVHVNVSQSFFAPTGDFRQSGKFTSTDPTKATRSFVFSLPSSGKPSETRLFQFMGRFHMEIAKFLAQPTSSFPGVDPTTCPVRKFVLNHPQDTAKAIFEQMMKPAEGDNNKLFSSSFTYSPQYPSAGLRARMPCVYKKKSDMDSEPVHEDFSRIFGKYLAPTFSEDYRASDGIVDDINGEPITYEDWKQCYEMAQTGSYIRIAQYVLLQYTSIKAPNGSAADWRVKHLRFMESRYQLAHYPSPYQPGISSYKTILDSISCVVPPWNVPDDMEDEETFLTRVYGNSALAISQDQQEEEEEVSDEQLVVAAASVEKVSDEQLVVAAASVEKVNLKQIHHALTDDDAWNEISFSGDEEDGKVFDLTEEVTQKPSKIKPQIEDDDDPTKSLAYNNPPKRKPIEHRLGEKPRQGDVKYSKVIKRTVFDDKSK